MGELEVRVLERRCVGCQLVQNDAAGRGKLRNGVSLHTDDGKGAIFVPSNSGADIAQRVEKRLVGGSSELDVSAGASGDELANRRFGDEASLADDDDPVGG